MAEGKEAPPVSTAGGPPQQWLNVIFHGPFLFIYYPSRVEVVAPDIREHVAVGGTWLKEKSCHYGTFFLTGINTPQDSFDPNKDLDQNGHIIFNTPGSINIEQGSYYRFVLQLPSKERALTVASMDPKKVFVGDYANNIKATSFGTVHVLSYKIGNDPDKPDIPQLEDLQWWPEPNRYGKVVVTCKDGVLTKTLTKYDFAKNLHIYVEAAFTPDPNHPIRDFKQMVTMLPGLKLGLVQQFPDLPFTDPTDIDELGIIREEQGGLRGLPPSYAPFTPPLVCDAPSIVVTGAQDPTP